MAETIGTPIEAQVIGAFAEELDNCSQYPGRAPMTNIDRRRLLVALAAGGAAAAGTVSAHAAHTYALSSGDHCRLS
jgi:hypothetical protein